jgi:hypothetical protein
MSANTSLSQSAYRVNNMWYDSSTGFPYQSNISLMTTLNFAGYKPTLPNNSYDATNFYQLDNLGGFCEGIYATRENNELKRTLQSGLSGESTLANTYVVMYASNYTARGFSLTTSCTVNNITAGTGGTCTRTSTLSLSSLSFGDIITGTEPFVLYENSFPGQQGAYCGYAGYSFASRRDRQTKKFVIFNPSSNTSNYQILYTSTSDLNVTSMTSVSSGTITSGGTISYSTSTTGNYYIWTDELCVAWQGFSPSGDTVMLYPLSQEHKYGFFSSDGHVFSTNNAESSRQDSGGGQTIAGITSGGTGTSIITALGSGRDNTCTSDGVAAGLKAGSYFSGEACVVYNASGIDPDGTGTIFTAESQADGNGSEMTTFTAVPAHARGAMSGAGAAWVAISGEGYSGSTGQDLVMRFNSAGTFQEAKGFTGVTTGNGIKKSYFGNGSGTGVAFSAGDFLWSRTDVQSWQDTDSTDKDESNMIMTNHIELPTPTSLTIVGEATETPEEACDNIPTGDSVACFMVTSTLAEGTVIFNNNNATYDESI